MLNRTVLYVTLVSVCAVLANGALFLLAPDLQVAEVRAAVWMATVGLFAHVAMHRLRRGSEGSIAFIPWLAAASITPTWVAVAGAAVSVLLAELTKRRAPVKILFNVMQISLAMGIATICFRAFGGSSLLGQDSMPLLEGARENAIPMMILIATFFVMNAFLLSGVIAVSEGGNLFQVWQQSIRTSISYDLLSAPVVYLFAWVYVSTGIT